MVFIDYYLPEATKGLKLEILDMNNKNIVTMLSDSTLLKSATEEVEDMNLSTTFRFVNTKLETKKGLNRFGWDLRKKGPWHKEGKRRYKNGPMVPPGNYRVKLTVGDKSMVQKFKVLPDPRAEADGINQAILEKQQNMQAIIMALLSEARLFQDDLEKESKKLEEKEDITSKERLERITSTLKLLKNDKGAYPQQMLVAQISYLFNMVNGADQQIGKDVELRYKELEKQLAGLKGTR